MKKTRESPNLHLTYANGAHIIIIFSNSCNDNFPKQSVSSNKPLVYTQFAYIGHRLGEPLTFLSQSNCGRLYLQEDL